MKYVYFCIILTINFFGCSKESNNKQGEKIETGKPVTYDSNKTDTINSDSNKTNIEKVESNVSLVNVKSKPKPSMVNERGIPKEKTIDSLTQQKESKNESLGESNKISSISSKLAEANQTKNKTESPKAEISAMTKESKVVLNDSKSLDANISISDIDVPVKLDDGAEKTEQRLIESESPPNVQLSKQLPSSKPPQKSKYPVLGHYRLHRGLPKP